MNKIDPRLETIFTERFLVKEMKAHGIKEVAVNRFLWALKGQPMVFDPAEKKILIDSSAPIETVRQRLNEKNGCADLDLNTDEAWGFVFFHEAAHADGIKSEFQCNEYARKRILQWRKGR